MEGCMKSPCSSDGKDNPSMLDQVWKDWKMTAWHRSNFSWTQPLKSTLKEEIECTDEIKHKEGDGETANKDSFCVWLLVWKIRRLSILGAHYNVMVQPKHCVTSFPSSKWHTVEVLEDLERGCQDDEIFRMAPLQDVQWHGCKDIAMKTAWTEKTVASQIISPPQPQGWVFFILIISHHLGKEKGGESPAMGKN